MDEGYSEWLIGPLEDIGLEICSIARERAMADAMRVILDDSKLTKEDKARIVYRILDMNMDGDFYRFIEKVLRHYKEDMHK